LTIPIDELPIPEVGRLAPVYNATHAAVPLCPVVDEDEFARGFPYRAHSGPFHAEEVLDEIVLAARDGGEITGFADVAIVAAGTGAERRETGWLRSLVFPPGRRKTGEALLAAAREWTRGAGREITSAFRIHQAWDHGGYRFHHLDYGMLSDRLVHVGALLLLHGFGPSGGELFLGAPDYPLPPPPEVAEGVELVVEEAAPERAALPGPTVRAYRDGREIGVFESCSAAEFSGGAELEDTVFVQWLNVVEEEQGRRLGLALHGFGLIESRKLGFRHAVISTDQGNDRALLFYANHGYRLVDTVHEFSRRQA
jgi:GNAT superfamily N-acetyltransferase